ncbi:MAG TPA: pitrilysin family protein [Thermoanaerobaculia bacterium]|nr:pitrilysin family protein [Thermoanaerobaculia bacterium]
MFRSATPLALTLGLGLSALAGAAGTPAVSDVPKIEFEKYTLPNGLQVILHVDRKLPVVHVNQWYHVGSKNEKPGRTGFAHLFEHMMFQGSANAKEDYFAYVERAGANLFEGGVNGTTSNDRTNYFATVPSANLENLLWLESDRLATLLEVTDQAKLDNQRDVVKNERRQGLENVPYGRWFEILNENLFPMGHPYSWTVIGSMADLSAATLEDVQEFFRTYYTPNNLSLVIAGDFDVDEAKRLVDKYFGPIPPGPALARPERWVPELPGEKSLVVADRVPQERVYIAWPTPPFYAEGDAELDLAGMVLADGLSSRLSRALVYDRQLATSVNAFQVSMEISGYFTVIATARPGASLDEIERLIDQEITRLAMEGPTVGELERARTKLEFNFISGLERIGGFGGKSDLLNQYNTFLGEPGRFDWDLGRYRNATPGDVSAAVSRWLDTPNRLRVRFVPETSGRPEAAEVDRAAVPPLGEDRPFTAPEVARAVLGNGLEVYVVERRDLPKVAVDFVTRAGAIADPAGKAGLAALTLATIDLGAGERDALELEQALGDLGTELTGGAGRESAHVGFEVLRRNLEPALGILGDVVRAPRFPADEVERERNRALDQLAQAEKNPNALLTRVRSRLAVGPEHPYGRPTQGVPATVGALGRDDVAAFWQARFRPASSALIFVGDVSLEEASRLAGAVFGSWQGEAAAEVEIPAPAPATPGRIYLVDRQDAAQSAISVFLPGPAAGGDGRWALQLADAVWGGGGFGTRLNLNLREDKGYSYGVFSALAEYREAGSWFGGGGVQTDKTRESVVELDRELDDLAGQRPITADELETAKLRALRGYAQQFEAYGRVAQQIRDLWTSGLPMSDLQAGYDEVAVVGLEAARAAAGSWAKPDAASMLVVGDRDKVEAGLRELGEVVVLDAEGRPVD